MRRQPSSINEKRRKEHKTMPISHQIFFALENTVIFHRNILFTLSCNTFIIIAFNELLNIYFKKSILNMVHFDRYNSYE